MNFTNIEALKNLISSNPFLSSMANANNNANTNTQASAQAATPATETMDLNANDYQQTSNAGFVTGMANEPTDPNIRVTKGEVAQALYNASGSPDVNVPAGYSKVDAWAKSSGLFGNSYNSNDAITNEEMVNLLRNYAGQRGFETQGYINLGDYYTGGEGLSADSRDAYAWAVDNQIYTGDTLNPSGVVTRGDFSDMVSAFVNAYEGELGLVPITPIAPIEYGSYKEHLLYGENETSASAAPTGYTGVQTQTETVDPSTLNGVTTTPTQPTTQTPTTQMPTTASTAEQTAMQNNFLQNLLNIFTGMGANNQNNASATGAQTATSYAQNNGTSAYTGTTTNIPATNTTTSKYKDVRQADMEAVNYVSERGLMVGTSDTTFNPDAGVTRAQMVQILYSMSGSPSNVGGKTSYKDVGSGEWYTNAVAWAQNTGLVGGYDDGTFRPNQVLTTEQAAAIFKRYAEQSGKNTAATQQINNPVNYNTLRGTSDVSNYAQDAVKWAVRDGMIDTSSGSINPKGELTRAQFAKYLMNYDINYNGGTGKSNYNITAIQNPGITQPTTPANTGTTQATSSGSTNLLDPNYWGDLLRKFPTSYNKQSSQENKNTPNFVKDPETGLYPNGTKSGIKWLDYDSSWSDNFNNSMAGANSSISAGKASASAAASSGSKVANSGLSNMDINMNYKAPSQPTTNPVSSFVDNMKQSAERIKEDNQNRNSDITKPSDQFQNVLTFFTGGGK